MTLRVRMLTERAGRGVLNRFGDVVDLPVAEAETYIRTNQAELVSDPAETEKRQSTGRSGRPPKIHA